MADDDEGAPKFFPATIFMAALEDSLLALAEFHSGRAGLWLDELQGRFEENAKSSYAEGMSMEAEAAMVKTTLALLQMTMQRVRSRLSAQ